MTGVPKQALEYLLAALDRLEIPYMVAGSAASSVHGLVRTTADLDMVVSFPEQSIQALVEVLQPAFYISEEQVHSAIIHDRAFNVIDLATAFKFDLFPLAADAYAQVEFSRRRYETTSIFSGEPIELAIASPEDIILNKLAWYRKGGAVSERQWNDVLGVIAVQRPLLDHAYLLNWASYLKITDLLTQVLAERQSPRP